MAAAAAALPLLQKGGDMAGDVVKVIAAELGKPIIGIKTVRLKKYRNGGSKTTIKTFTVDGWMVLGGGACVAAVATLAYMCGVWQWKEHTWTYTDKDGKKTDYKYHLPGAGTPYTPGGGGGPWDLLWKSTIIGGIWEFMKRKP